MLKLLLRLIVDKVKKIQDWFNKYQTKIILTLEILGALSSIVGLILAFIIFFR